MPEQITFVGIIFIVISLSYVTFRFLRKFAIGRGKSLLEKGIESSYSKQAQHRLLMATSRFGRAQKFVISRLSSHKFTGLPLTLMLAAALYIFMSGTEVLEEFLESKELVTIDERINAQIAPFRNEPLTEVIGWITAFGDVQTMIAVCLVMSAFLWVFKRAFSIVPLWLAIIGATATTWAGKYILGRDRPVPIEGFFEMSPSFPSGHATTATAVYGFLAYLIVRETTNARARFEIIFWTIVFILMICFSRIYLGLHYSSDVLLGLLVGSFWLLVGFMVAEFRRSKLSPP